MRWTVLLLSLLAAGCAGTAQQTPDSPPVGFNGMPTGADTGAVAG